MRNFKKTLSLVLSVLMVVSCCSVVFSTFASAYTTNDETTPNYGVYTYDFLKADGTSAYPTNGSINHNLLSCGGKGSMAVGDSEAQVHRRYLVGASYVDKTGMHIVGYSNVPLTTPSWATRAFVLDSNAGISNEKIFLYLQNNTTYTFILKYKLESLDAAYYAGKTYDPSISSDKVPHPELEGTTAAQGAYAASGAYIGLGYLNPVTLNKDSSTTNDIIDSKVSNTAGTSGESTVFTDGWSELITAEQDEWQYLNITVNADDIELSYPPAENALSKYVQIFVRPQESEKPVMFHIESLTVVAVDNSVTDKYTVFDNTTADGTLTENVKVLRNASNVHTYDFVTESQGSIVDTYPSKNHDVMAGSIYDIDGGTAATTGKQPQSYVSTANDATRGLHFTSCYKGGQAVGVTNYGSKVFLRDPDVAISNSASLTGPCYLVLQNNTTYTFILKYKVEALTEGNSGYVGISFYDPSPHSAAFPTFYDQGAGGGMHQILAVSELIRSTSDEWAYLVATVNADNVKFNKYNEDSYTGLNRYVTLFASSNNATTAKGDTSNGYITAHFESVTVITESNTEKDDVTLVTMGDDGFKCYNATDYAGMTLPRPADTQKGYVGSHWVDANGNTVSTVPSSEGVNFLYSVYDNYKFDFEGNNTIQYDPNNKWGTGKANAATYVDSPILGDEGNTVIKCTENRNTGTAANANLSANFTNIAFNVSGNGDIGYKFKTSTTYRISFKYYCESSIWDESRGMRFQVYKSKAEGIGVDGNKTTTNYITDSAWSSRWHIFRRRGRCPHRPKKAFFNGRMQASAPTIKKPYLSFAKNHPTCAVWLDVMLF